MNLKKKPNLLVSKITEIKAANIRKIKKKKE